MKNFKESTTGPFVFNQCPVCWHPAVAKTQAAVQAHAVEHVEYMRAVEGPGGAHGARQ